MCLPGAVLPVRPSKLRVSKYLQKFELSNYPSEGVSEPSGPGPPLSPQGIKQLLACGKCVDFVTATYEAANVHFSRDPCGVAVSKDDVATISAVVVTGVRKVFVGTIGSAASVIGIVNNPSVRGTTVLANKIVFITRLGCAIDVIQD